MAADMPKPDGCGGGREGHVSGGNSVIISLRDDGGFRHGRVAKHAITLAEMTLSRGDSLPGDG
jgi:hypothetical protein